MKIISGLACAGLLTVLAASPALAGHVDNATIEGTESAPGSQGAPSAADRTGNLVTVQFGQGMLPNSGPRGGPVPKGTIDRSRSSVWQTPGSDASSDGE